MRLARGTRRMGARVETAAPDPEDLALRQLVASGRIDEATERVIRRYGAELYGWLEDAVGGADADDAFSLLSLELWRSLRRYDGRCSMRTWCYMLARHCAFKVRAMPRRAREVLVSHIPSIAAAVTYVRTSTQSRARAADAAIAALRETLDADDRALLVLRIDRGLPWRDVAQVLLGEAAAAADVERHAAQLRKRFERIKQRLRAAAARG